MPQSDKGCFGSVMAYDEKSATCQACIACHACADNARSRLERLSEKLNIQPLIASQRAFRGAHHQGGTTRIQLQQSWQVDKTPFQSLPKKVQPLAARLDQHGIDLKNELLSRRNPYRQMRPKYMEVACDLLLEAGFTRSELRAALLIAHPHWQARTADSHVLIVCQLLEGMNVCHEDESGRFTVEDAA